MLLCVSCGKKAASETDSKEVDFFAFDFENSFDSEPKSATLNDIIDSVKFIPLETTEKAFLSDQFTFAMIGDEMFVSDARSPIFRFDFQGRFVKQETYVGRGPNEVLFAHDWYANSNLKQINVVSVGSYMVVSKTESGEKYSIGFNERQGFDRVPLNDSTFVSAQLLTIKDIHKTYLYFMNKKGDIVHTKERNDELANYNSETTEYKWALPYERYWLAEDYRGDAIFHDIFNDTLYRVKSYREITPHLVFEREQLRPNPADVHKVENKKKQVYFSDVKESRDYVFLSYRYDNEGYRDIWSKADGSLKLRSHSEKFGYIKEYKFPYTLPNGTEILLPVVYADKEHLYGMIQALDACKFLPDVKEDDNPVVVIAKLKK